MSKKTTNKAEEQISNRVLTMFTLGAVLLWALSYLYNMIDIASTQQTGYLITRILLVLSCIGVIVGIVWFWVSKKNGNPRLDKVINGPSIVCLFSVLTISTLFLLYDYILGMKLIYIFIPSIVILYLVFNVYQRIFFWLLLSEALITLIVYFISNSYNLTFKIISALVIVLISLLCVLLSVKINKGKGILFIGKSRVPVLEKNTVVDLKSVSIIYASSALLAIISAFLPMAIVFYVPYVFIGFLVCSSIYFTIRLM